MPAVWASASVKITPGTSGSSGKCPANIGSSLENCVSHSADTPGSEAINFRTNTNGGRCGKPKKLPVTRDEGRGPAAAVFCFLSLVTRHYFSPVDEVSKLPASYNPCDSNQIAVVIARRIGIVRCRGQA